MKIVVVGGTGLIGSKVVNDLRQQARRPLPAPPARRPPCLIRTYVQRPSALTEREPWERFYRGSSLSVHHRADTQFFRGRAVARYCC
jgi:nucleoside-diphosphate-sugar epimerase